jgi:hypothetical protein
MKKSAKTVSGLLIGLLVIIPLFSICQEQNSGLYVGVNFGKWLGDDDIFAQSLADEMNYQDGFSGFSFDSKSRTGFSMGFFYDFPVAKSVSIQPEFSYSQKGARFSGDGSFFYYGDSYSVKSEVVMRLDYLDVVVLTKYSLPGNGVKPYFAAGLGVGYLLSAQMKVKATVDGESDSNSSKMDGYKKLDAHLNFGAGIDFSDLIRIDLRYALGLTPILEEDILNLQNGAISLNFAVCF